MSRWSIIATFVTGLVAFGTLDIVGARTISRNSVAQHVQFSNRTDHRPNVWPFELYLSPARKL